MDWVATEHESGVIQTQHRMLDERHDSIPREVQRFLSPPTGNAAAQNSPSAADEQGWPQLVLNEMKDMLLLLSSEGNVLYAAPSCKSITGYDASQLEQNALARFIHSDDQDMFSEEMNECMTRIQPVQCHFRFCTKDNNNNTSCILEAYGHPHMKTGTPSESPENRDGGCIGIILLCRPYPTRSSQLIDSFLEHKIENVRLNHRIAQLREEEEEDLATYQQSYPSDSAGEPSSRHNSAHSGRTNSNQSSLPDAAAFGEENESSDTLTIDDPDAQSFSANVADTLSQEEDMSHIDGIEMLTGLHYGEGERSQGLSTGVRQGRLIHFDMESAKLDQQTRIIQDSDRKKRQKGEYMCTDCGTSDSPEWRKGPEGPKTLCNACGLRWAKKEKKRQDHI
ncbi:GATA-domain-containing protein [Aspergillus alliaceus]|uniref:GATA-domain-containing protein n=1 Tax=Petromyces alliaceus TaxID=209559 RepID=A0A5N7C1K3_PETAA|nr:GATA-domain-containing protein [Aspergillus alliaceus]